MVWQRIFVRIVALRACLVAIAGLVAITYVHRQIGRTERAAQAEIGQLGTTVDRVAASLDTVGSSTTNAADTAAEARTTLNEAAVTLRDTGSTLDEAAGALGFFSADLAESFREQGTQLRTLATQLEATGQALDGNSADLRTISRDLALVARDAETQAAWLREAADPDPARGRLARLTRDAVWILTGISVPSLLLLFGTGASLYLLTTESWHAPQRGRQRAERDAE